MPLTEYVCFQNVGFIESVTRLSLWSNKPTLSVPLQVCPKLVITQTSLFQILYSSALMPWLWSFVSGRRQSTISAAFRLVRP